MVTTNPGLVPSYQIHGRPRMPCKSSWQAGWFLSEDMALALSSGCIGKDKQNTRIWHNSSSSLTKSLLINVESKSQTRACHEVSASAPCSEDELGTPDQPTSVRPQRRIMDPICIVLYNGHARLTSARSLGMFAIDFMNEVEAQDSTLPPTKSVTGGLRRCTDATVFLATTLVLTNLESKSTIRSSPSSS